MSFGCSDSEAVAFKWSSDLVLVVDVEAIGEIQKRRGRKNTNGWIVSGPIVKFRGERSVELEF